MTATALTLNPSAGQGYNATIQQNPVRVKINASLSALNTLKGSL